MKGKIQISLPYRVNLVLRSKKCSVPHKEKASSCSRVRPRTAKSAFFSEAFLILACTRKVSTHLNVSYSLVFRMVWFVFVEAITTCVKFRKLQIFPCVHVHSSDEKRVLKSSLWFGIHTVRDYPDPQNYTCNSHKNIRCFKRRL